MKLGSFERTDEMNMSLGLPPNPKDSSGDLISYKPHEENNYLGLIDKPFGSVDDGAPDLRSEVISIPSMCPNCTHMGESLTAISSIPHFKV